MTYRDTPMTMTRVVLLVILAAGVHGATHGATAQGGPVAYTGATVWDGTGAPAVPGATLLVDGGRIVAVGTNVAVPTGARTVSLAGRYVMPGMVEAHAHVSGDWAPDHVTSPEERVRGDLLLYLSGDIFRPLDRYLDLFSLGLCDRLQDALLVFDEAPEEDLQDSRNEG